MMNKICYNCMKEIPRKQTCCPFCGCKEVKNDIGVLKVGTLLDKRYVVGKMVDRSGFGITYIGKDRKLNQTVQIREFYPTDYACRQSNGTVENYDDDKKEQFERTLTRFVNEGMILAQIRNSDNVLTIYDVVKANNTAYQITETLCGKTLRQTLDEGGIYTESECLQLLKPVMDCLNELHKHHLIHRDICPENIFLCDDGRVKLLNFGASRYVPAGHTKSLSVIVKAGYSPIEQYQSDSKQGPFSDVYGIAATMYRVLCGKKPEEALERRIAMESGNRDPLIRPAKLNRKISENTEIAILNGLNVLVEERTPTIKAFYEECTNRTMTRRHNNNIQKIDLYRLPKWFRYLSVALTVAALSVVVLFGLNVWKFSSGFKGFSLTNDKDISVADVCGMKAGEALELLKQQGLNGSVIMVKAENEDVMTVLSQSVSAGLWVNSGTDITLHVAYGGNRENLGDEDVVFLPQDITGMNKKEAFDMIYECGLKPGSVTLQYSKEFYGCVVACNVSAFAEIKAGTTVNLTVSNGYSSYEAYLDNACPNLKGSDLDYAYTVPLNAQRGKLLFDTGAVELKGGTIDFYLTGSLSYDNSRKADIFTIGFRAAQNRCNFISLDVEKINGRTEEQAIDYLNSVGLNVQVVYVDDRIQYEIPVKIANQMLNHNLLRGNDTTLSNVQNSIIVSNDDPSSLQDGIVYGFYQFDCADNLFTVYHSNGAEYGDTVHLLVKKKDARLVTVYFDCDGCSVYLRNNGMILMNPNNAIGKMPYAYKDGYDFLGWYKTDGEAVDENTIITKSMFLVPYWQYRYE